MSTCMKHEFPRSLLLPRIPPMPPGTQMSSVSPAQSSFMWSERICDSVPFRPLLCPQSWNDCFAMSHTLATHERFKGTVGISSIMDQPKGSEGQFSEFLPPPSPCLWCLDWGITIQHPEPVDWARSSVVHLSLTIVSLPWRFILIQLAIPCNIAFQLIRSLLTINLLPSPLAMNLACRWLCHGGTLDTTWHLICGKRNEIDLICFYKDVLAPT